MIIDKQPEWHRGFALIELLMSMVVIAILAGLIISVQGKSTEQAKMAKAKVQLGKIAASLELYYDDWGEYPDTINHLVSIEKILTQAAENGVTLKIPRTYYDEENTTKGFILACLAYNGWRPFWALPYTGKNGLGNDSLYWDHVSDIDFRGLKAPYGRDLAPGVPGGRCYVWPHGVGGVPLSMRELDDLGDSSANVVDQWGNLIYYHPQGPKGKFFLMSTGPDPTGAPDWMTFNYPMDADGVSQSDKTSYASNSSFIIY